MCKMQVYQGRETATKHGSCLWILLSFHLLRNTRENLVYLLEKKKANWGDQMAQQVKAGTTKISDLSLASRLHRVEGEI